MSETRADDGRSSRLRAAVRAAGIAALSVFERSRDASCDAPPGAGRTPLGEGVARTSLAAQRSVSRATCWSTHAPLVARLKEMRRLAESEAFKIERGWKEGTVEKQREDARHNRSPGATLARSAPSETPAARPSLDDEESDENPGVPRQSTGLFWKKAQSPQSIPRIFDRGDPQSHPPNLKLGRLIFLAAVHLTSQSFHPIVTT